MVAVAVAVAVVVAVAVMAVAVMAVVVGVVMVVAVVMAVVAVAVAAVLLGGHIRPIALGDQGCGERRRLARASLRLRADVPGASRSQAVTQCAACRGVRTSAAAWAAARGGVGGRARWAGVGGVAWRAGAAGAPVHDERVEGLAAHLLPELVVVGAEAVVTDEVDQ